jgi:DNA-binding GntR family transcriptional regulator
MVSDASKEDIQDFFLVKGMLAGELAAQAVMRMTKGEPRALQNTNRP